MQTEVLNKQGDLSHHPMYENLNSIENLRVFMKYHVFAVWDFMSLLKSLQKEITCTTIPWKESTYEPELVRLINEIVLGEESDVDAAGNPTSHFALYLKAMEEVGADTAPILNFLEDLDFEKLPIELASILKFHLSLAENGKVHEVASSFFYGREKLIPEMFQSIVDVIKKAGLDCPSLIYYLERHIEVDGGEHGPMALKCLSQLTDTEAKKSEATLMAVKSLEMRWDLWDFIQSEF